MGTGSGGQTASEGKGRRTGRRYKGLESRAGLGCEQVQGGRQGYRESLMPTGGVDAAESQPHMSSL